jgi:chromosomal replication initiation ATPase DnaA
MAPRIEPEDVEAAVCGAFRAEPEALRERGRWHNDPRAVAFRLCRKWTGWTIRALGERFGGVRGAQVTKFAAAIAQRLAREPGLADKVRQCELTLAKKESGLCT